MGRLKEYLIELQESMFPNWEFYEYDYEGQPSMTLSKQQAQLLKGFVAQYLATLESDTIALRFACRDYYAMADKDTGEEGEYYFGRLNKARNALRWVRNEKKKFSDIQRSLKQLSK